MHLRYLLRIFVMLDGRSTWKWFWLKKTANSMVWLEVAVKSSLLIERDVVEGRKEVVMKMRFWGKIRYSLCLCVWSWCSLQLAYHLLHLCHKKRHLLPSAQHSPSLNCVSLNLPSRNQQRLLEERTLSRKATKLYEPCSSPGSGVMYFGLKMLKLIWIISQLVSMFDLSRMEWDVGIDYTLLFIPLVEVADDSEILIGRNSNQITR